ncbi:cytochrome P450 [Xylariaceae sp. FL0594]|nr:cytochrome P450 [Xylariaceae sp. FL0594]
MISLLILVALALATTSYLLYQWALPKPIPGIPYDEHARRRIMGNLPDLVAMVRETGRARPFFSGHVRRHRSALTQVWLTPLGKPALILADFRAAQDMLLRRSREFDKGAKATTVFTTVVPDHHISMPTTDPRFKGNRDLVRDLMTPGFLHEVSAPEIYAKTQLLVELWTVKARLGGGRPFDAHKDLVDASIDIINAAAFGLGDEQSTVKHQLDHLLSLSSSSSSFKINEKDGSITFPQLPQLPAIAAIEAVGKYLGEQFKAPFAVLAHRVNMLRDARLRRNFRLKDEFLRNEIDKAVERLRRGESGLRSAMDFVLQREMNQAEKMGRTPVFHSPRIHDELFGYIVAGHDTTSTALMWMVKTLADHPEAQHKLRASLCAAYPDPEEEGRQPTAVELWKVSVPYLDAVIEECFRLHTPIPVTLREAMVDTQLLGIHIPKDTAVFIVAEGPSYTESPLPLPLPSPPHTSPSSSSSSYSVNEKRGNVQYGEWDTSDMHMFKPERWLKPDPEEGKEIFDPRSGPLLTFSLGPRMCFGKRLAYLETRIVLALLVWNFEFLAIQDPDLSSSDVEDSITSYPRRCFVSLRKL